MKSPRPKPGKPSTTTASMIGPMPPLIPRYTLEEFSRRGREIYERVIRGSTSDGDAGKFVAIDIESEDFELDRDDFQATERLIARRPGAQIWMMRVGQPTAYRIGFR